MTCEEIKECVGTDRGIATLQGRTYLLVSTRCVRHPQTGERTIDAVAEDAWEPRPGRLMMTRLVVSDEWRRGGEALDALPGGEYDWVARRRIPGPF